MASVLLNRDIPLNIIYKNGAFILISIRKYFKYENGQKTDILSGYKYEVVDTVSFDKLQVKIEGQKEPLMPPEDLEERRENGERFFVEFIHGRNRLYNHNMMNGRWSVEDSFSADDVRFAETIES